LYLNIIINKGNTTLLMDEYVYSRINDLQKDEFIIPYSTDCDRKFSEKIIIIHISCETSHF